MNKTAFHRINPLILLGMLGISQISHASLLSNGGFEAGVFTPAEDNTQWLAVDSDQLTGWNINGQAITWLAADNNFSLNPSSGDHFINLTDGAPGGVSQIIATEVGRSYVLSFDLGSSPNGGEPVSVKVSADGSSKVFTSSESTGEAKWERFSLPFTATAAKTKVSFTGIAGADFIAIDNTSVDETVVEHELGYNYTSRTAPQVIMAGASPSIIDDNDTTFDILAIVRPGAVPLRSVAINRASPVFKLELQHVNTLDNGDQLWKTTYYLNRGAFGNATLPVKWGPYQNQFVMRATDTKQHPPFPLFTSGNYPATAPLAGPAKKETLKYNTTKREYAQVIMAGVTPSIVDLYDSSFDIVAWVRPGATPVEKVVVRHGTNELMNIYPKKTTELPNGDQLWVFTHPIPAGGFGIATAPVELGNGPTEYNVQAIDGSGKVVSSYPDLVSGDYPALAK